MRPVPEAPSLEHKVQGVSSYLVPPQRLLVTRNALAANASAEASSDHELNVPCSVHAAPSRAVDAPHAPSAPPAFGGARDGPVGAGADQAAAAGQVQAYSCLFCSRNFKSQHAGIQRWHRCEQMSWSDRDRSQRTRLLNVERTQDKIASVLLADQACVTLAYCVALALCSGYPSLSQRRVSEAQGCTPRPARRPPAVCRASRLLSAV